MAESRDAVQARWWAAWRGQDFSWAGLAGKPVGENGRTVHGGLRGERTLQDYWRRDPLTGAVRDDATPLAAGELVQAPDGALWHVVHVPLAWADDTPAKARWDAATRDRVAALVAARLAAARVAPVDRLCQATALDGRAQLQGAVLAAAPTASGEVVPPLVADWAAIPAWDAREAAIAAGIRFHNASFCGDVSFDNAIFADDVGFYGATFADEASFFSANFSGDANFRRATFAGDASFHSTKVFGDASFYWATFFGYASFGVAIFSGDASFISATFACHASFEDATCTGSGGFSSATFTDDASFYGATFAGDARFQSTTFAGDAHFDSATFAKRLSFATARFRSLTYFTHLKAWPTQAEHWHRAFLSTEFARTVSFEGSGLQGLAAFDGIRIAPDASLLLDDLPDAQAKTVFKQELCAALAAGTRDAGVPAVPSQALARRGRWTRWRVRWRMRRRRHAKRGRIHAAQDNRLKELERGCRALVVEMEKLRDRARAQLFYRFEIEARRRQHETPRWEKIASCLYDWLGDYGASIARPPFALLFSIPLMAPLYGGIIAWQRPALCTERLAKACGNMDADPRGTLWPLTWGSLAFSASRTLPFGAWEVKAEDPAHNNPVRMLLLGEADTWQHVLIRALATLHSVFALAMAFLSGIAIRRRFQLD